MNINHYLSYGLRETEIDIGISWMFYIQANHPVDAIKEAMTGHCLWSHNTCMQITISNRNEKKNPENHSQMYLSCKASFWCHLPVVEVHIKTGVVGGLDLSYIYLETLLYQCYYTLLSEAIIQWHFFYNIGRKFIPRIFSLHLRLHPDYFFHTVGLNHIGIIESHWLSLVLFLWLKENQTLWPWLGAESKVCVCVVSKLLLVSCWLGWCKL